MIPRSMWVRCVTCTSSMAVGAGTPMMTQLPPQPSVLRASPITAGWPTHSKAHAAPSGSSSLMAATLSWPSPASTKSVAPNCLASASFWGSVSTATMRPASESFSAWMTLRPMPPTPNTVTSWPCFTSARLNTAPTPVMTPQPMRAADSSGTSFGMGTTWLAWTTVVSANTEAAAKL